jgi:Holliday junction resolvase-like predicted endonuclease
MADPVTIQDIYDLFRASQAEADRRAAEADRRAAEADRRLERLERIAANTSREVAGLTTRWGQFVENLVEPAVIRLFQARGIDVQETSRRMKSKRPGAQMEIDIFAVDGDVAVAIEVKSRLSQRDVDDFLDKLGRFRQAFPHYTDYQIYGAVAGIEIDAGIDRYAYQQGLFVIQQTGDTVKIANDAAFQPAAW